ncbi:hypothetical protein M2479_001902 [Breznakia sp. PH5-24]|nr:hypothetical protein [Breznakia sp. PH5-24]
MLFFHFLKYFVVKSSFKKGTFSNKELSLQIDLLKLFVPSYSLSI